MIYIKNTTETQTIFIPRNELQKEAYITSTKTYEDGYREGLEDGKEYQKDQLLNLYVTENGQYEREDGWGTVTVDMSIPDCSGAYDEGYNQGYEDGQNSVECPEGGCNLGEGEIVLDTTMAGFYELYAAEDGYDGWSKFYVTLENDGAIKIHRAEELIQMFNEGWGIDFGTYHYVGGKITEIQKINVEFGNATYVLDNGLKVYRGDWIDGNPFGEDQIKVGGYIVVYGIIQDYKGELQLKAHSQVIAYQECEGGEISCNLIKETFTLKGDYEQFTASDYGADGFESITIDAYDYGKQKFNEGYEEGINQGGTVTTYSTIREVYNTEDVTIQVSCKGTVAVCLTNGSTYYMIVTDHTGAIYVTAKQPYDVGDECFLAGEVRKTTSTNMRYMSNPIIEVLSRGNYVVMPTDAVELTNKDELYIPNKYGNAEMKYLYYQGEVQKIASNGNITITTPESVSADGRIILRTAKEEWRNNLVVGDYIRMYMFTTNGDGYFLPTDIIKLGTEGGSCNLEDKWVYPSMADRDGNGYIVVDQSEGYDGLDRVVIDPTTIYNEGVAAGGSCNLINPIFFCESEGNTINAESVEIPTFVYEGNQHYNVWALNMTEYEEFKIQLRFQPTNGGNEEPVNIFGCEDTDWDNTTFGARIYVGTIYFRMSGDDVAYPYSDNAWYDVEMGYNSSKRWIIVNGETLLESDHAFVNKPSQTLMIGAINSGGNAFRPFYGKIAAAYVEANGSQVWLLPKEDGHMDVYWNDTTSPWVSISGENNARFESGWMSGDGMKTITWLGKRISCPSVQDEALLYDTIAFSYTVDGWRSHNLVRDNMTNDCDDRPLDCLLLRNRYGECTVMTKLDICSGTARLENGWNGGSIIYSLKSNTITKFSNSSINSYHLKSIDTGFAQLEENAIINCNALTDIKVTILNNDLSYQFATNCFSGLPTEGTITIDKNAGVTLTDDEITSFFRTIVGEGWTITIE